MPLDSREFRSQPTVDAFHLEGEGRGIAKKFRKCSAGGRLRRSTARTRWQTPGAGEPPPENGLTMVNGRRSAAPSVR